MLTIITPSPDDKRIYRISALRSGQVHRAQSVLRYPSGKGVNAARSALRVHAASPETLCLCLPVGTSFRDALEREFQDAAVELHLTALTQETRSCITVLEEGGCATELIEEAQPMEPPEAVTFRERALACSRSASTLLLTGSFPEGLDQDLYYHCAMRAHDGGGRVLLDAQAEVLRLALRAEPEVVKINREELGNTLGIQIEREGIREAARDLQSRGAHHVIVTDGSAPVVWLDEQGFLHEIIPPKVACVNPVGSGDAMSGVLAASLDSGKGMEEALRRAVAAGSANAASLLPGEFDSAMWEHLIQEVRFSTASV